MPLHHEFFNVPFTMKTATVLACVASVVAAEGLSKVAFRSAVKPNILNADGSVSYSQHTVHLSLSIGATKKKRPR